MGYDKLRTLTNAAEHARKGRLDQAISAYRSVLERQPDELRARLKIGDLLARKQTREDHDQAANTYLQVADTYADQGFAQKAIAIYRRVLQLQPLRLDVQLQLAEALKGRGLVGDVRKVLESALLKLDAAEVGDPVDMLRDMARLDPSNVSVSVRLAELLVEKNDNTTALEELESAAQHLRTSGQNEAYLLVGEKRLTVQPENTPLRRELAGLYLRRDMPHRALELLRGCYDAAATEPASLTLLVKCFLALDQQSEAVTAFKALAEAHEEAGQTSLRDGALRNVLKLDPADPDALAGLGLVAEPEPEPELEPKPKPEQELSTRDSGRYGSVDLSEAIDALVNIERDEEQVGMWLEEARVFVEFGMVEDARSHIDQILGKTPGSPEALALLAALEAPRSPGAAQPEDTADAAASDSKDSRSTSELAELLEPNWLEPELIVDLD